jgi:murein DD-endopeptidase MepM/ murein hydrolase activator NlpD
MRDNRSDIADSEADDDKRRAARYQLAWVFDSWPTSQRFGENPDWYNVPPYFMRGHEGIDYAISEGTVVKAAHDGIVVLRADSPRDYGQFIALWDSTQRCMTYYCHLSDIFVTQYQRVNAGDNLGRSGNTGHSTGAHLHFGLAATDENGTRLAWDNGYQGFIDSLDDKNVWWDRS